MADCARKQTQEDAAEGANFRRADSKHQGDYLANYPKRTHMLRFKIVVGTVEAAKSINQFVKRIAPKVEKLSTFIKQIGVVEC